MRSDDLLSIGRSARLTGLSIGALRQYDQMGVLGPAAINPETGYRSYARGQVEAARLIAQLRAMEMPLTEIRAVLQASDEARQAVIANHRKRLQARTERLLRIVHQLNQEIPMSPPDQPARLLDPETHRSLGVELFNHVWRLLETEDRTVQQDDEMIHAAHASRWHWAQSGVDDLQQRLAVGEWQCSRVYAVLDRGEPALHHADRSRELSEGSGIEDWVRAAALEAMARASRVAGDGAAFARWREEARKATAAIADQEDREVIEGDLATLET